MKKGGVTYSHPPLHEEYKKFRYFFFFLPFDFNVA